MPSTFVEGEPNLAALASKVFNGDWERFPEILDLNPDLDIFGVLPQGLEVIIPEIEDILQVAKPELTSIANSLGGINKAVSTGDFKAIEGYAKDAIKSVGVLNGGLNDAISVIQQNSQDRNYQNTPVQLVNWLLENR